MKVYLAGPYRSRAQLQRCAAELEQVGYTPCARWLEGDHEGAPDAATDALLADRQRWAREDLADVHEAAVVVAFTASAAWYMSPAHTGAVPVNFGASGGRHIETGYALRTGKHVVLVGQPENVFHWLPGITRVGDWHEALVHLAAYLVEHERERVMAG